MRPARQISGFQTHSRVAELLRECGVQSVIRLPVDMLGGELSGDVFSEVIGPAVERLHNGGSAEDVKKLVCSGLGEICEIVAKLWKPTIEVRRTAFRPASESGDPIVAPR